jgi:hypothetical protein
MQLKLKKLAVAVAVVLALGAGSMASAEFKTSWGGSLSYLPETHGGVQSYWVMNSSGNRIGQVARQVESGIGVNGFYDITYAELGAGLSFLGGYAEGSRGSVRSDNDEMRLDNTDYSRVDFDIIVMLKYPFKIFGFYLAPTVGMDYALCVSIGDAKKPFDASVFWIKFGLISDVPLTDAMYLRAAVLLGGGGEDKASKDAAKALTAAGLGIDGYPAKVHNWEGFTLKLGVGINL